MIQGRWATFVCDNCGWSPTREDPWALEEVEQHLSKVHGLVAGTGLVTETMTTTTPLLRTYEGGAVRTFETGATRDTEEGKLDFEGFFSPLAWERFAEFMHKNRVQSNGELRSGSNWAKGIPIPAYIKSLWRHFFAVWKTWRGWGEPRDLEDQLCAVIFNAQGMLHEVIRKRMAPQTKGDEFGPKTL